MINFDPLKYQQMQAGAGSANFFAGQQQRTVRQPEEENIFAVGAKGAVNGAAAASSGLGQTQRVDFKQGLVDRLNGIDARFQAPEQRNAVQGNKLYLMA